MRVEKITVIHPPLFSNKGFQTASIHIQIIRGRIDLIKDLVS